MDENKEKDIIEQTESETEETASAIEEAEAEIEEIAEDDLSIYLDEDDVSQKAEIPVPVQVAPVKKKGGLIGALVALGVAVVALIAVCVMFLSNMGGGGVGLSNMSNLGIAAESNGKVYYASTVGSGLYEADLKTLETKQLSAESILFIQEVDGAIYYVDVVNAKLCKFVDGVNDEVIVSELCYAPQFVGEYIYYLRPSDYFVYRVKVSGSEAEKVLDVPCNAFYVEGKKLYFEDINEARFCTVDLQAAIDAAKTELPEIDIDATSDPTMYETIPGRTPEEIGAQILFEGFPDTVNVVGDAIYYSDSANGNAIYQYKDGATKVLVNGITARYVNVSGKYLYYTNMNDYALYRMNLDGTDIRKISGDGEMAINNCVVGDLVIYAYMGPTGDMGTAVVDTEGNQIALLPELLEDMYIEENTEEFDESIDMSAEVDPAEGETVTE